ncbi:MAG: hypothetical protein K2M27_06375 [Muribaculaceae bacterium]|nr:hypothetical protein [Muribaculaceae bacterium]
MSLISCSRNGNLTATLDHAGENRAELEKVLEHYSSEPEKLQAAEWLIVNMPGHYAVYGEAVRTFSDSIAAKAMTKAEADSLWMAISQNIPRPERRTDLSSMSSGLLIDNIDGAFRTWRESPWRDSVDFDSFLCHILPYRIADEPLRSGWRDSIKVKFHPLLKGIKDPRRAFEIIHSEIFSQKKTKALKYPHLMDVVAYRNYFSTICKERCIYLAGVCRAMGLPVAYDNCGRWANYSDNVHSWVSLVLPGGTYTIVDDDSVARKHNKIDASGYVLKQPMPEGYPYDGDFRKRVVKVWRSTFHVNPAKDAPHFGNSAWINHHRSIDVSAEYGLTGEVTVDAGNEVEYVWLCTHSLSSGWIAQAYASTDNGKAIFTNIGDSVMLLPMTLRDGRPEAVGNPFYISRGMKIEITADTSRKVSATLTRKYPISPGKLNGYAQMPGTRIMAATDSGFRNPVTLYTITDVPIFHNTAYIKQSGRYRCLWAETDHPARHYIDSLAAYGPDGKVIESTGKRNLDFGRLVEISRIDYYPRHDGNFIEPGDEYELTWWDGEKWRSLGRQLSDGYELIYDNIPEGALLLLHDLTKGKEERPFTLKNGRQIWW